MAKEEVSKLGRGDGFVGAQKEGLFGQHVNKGGDGVVGVTIRGLGLGQVSDQVEGDMGLGTRRDGMGLKETRCGLGRGFDALTGSTRGDVGAYSGGVFYSCLGRREGAYNPCPKWARIYRLMTESGSKAFPASRAPEV